MGRHSAQLFWEVTRPRYQLPRVKMNTTHSICPMGWYITMYDGHIEMVWPLLHFWRSRKVKYHLVAQITMLSTDNVLLMQLTVNIKVAKTSVNFDTICFMYHCGKFFSLYALEWTKQRSFNLPMVTFAMKFISLVLTLQTIQSKYCARVLSKDGVQGNVIDSRQ